MTNDMPVQVIIPMSGFGERFRSVGYKVPKPLIEVDSYPILKHVTDMFPNVDDIIFICNREHISEASYRMNEILKEIRPEGKVVVIEPNRLGPVQAVLEAREFIDLDRPTVINYCDFTCYWDFEHFTEWARENDCDGAIPAYSGFHPHMLDSTNYAYVKHKNGWIEDIQEKQPFTDTPMDEFASSGTYYFRSGRTALEYCERCVEEGHTLNGEFYVSLTYKPMLADGKRVKVYPIQHFMQWGTPSDLEVYKVWSETFANLVKESSLPPEQTGSVLVPLAGEGSRFSKEGYKQPKPLVDVSGKPMVVQATSDLPNPEKTVFVVRDDLPMLPTIETSLAEHFPNHERVSLSDLSEGQAITCLKGLELVDLQAPLTIGACDSGLLYNAEAFHSVMSDPDVDVIVWGKKGYANAIRKPEMYGWIETAASEHGRDVSRITVKEAPSELETASTIVGSFTFKRAEMFERSVKRLIERDGRVNGEFYVDSCIEDAISLGYRCVLFEVDSYMSWGTPDEYLTFKYWQSCFHKWEHHPYRLEDDQRVPLSAKSYLTKEYSRESWASINFKKNDQHV